MVYITINIVLHQPTEHLRPQRQAAGEAHVVGGEAGADDGRHQRVAELFRRRLIDGAADLIVGVFGEVRAVLFVGSRADDDGVHTGAQGLFDTGPGHVLQPYSFHSSPSLGYLRIRRSYARRADMSIRAMAGGGRCRAPQRPAAGAGKGRGSPRCGWRAAGGSHSCAAGGQGRRRCARRPGGPPGPRQ